MSAIVIHPPGGAPQVRCRLDDPTVAGAAILAILTYPGPDEALNQRRALLRFRLALQQDRPLNEPAPEERELVREQVGRTVLRFDDIERRLQHRLDVGHIGAGLMMRHHHLKVGVPAHTRLKTHEDAMALGAGGAEVTNFTRRKWKPSIPVLHLAAALAYMTQEIFKGGEGFDLLQLGRNADHIRTMVAHAEEFEPMAVAMRPRSISTAMQWRLRHWED